MYFFMLSHTCTQYKQHSPTSYSSTICTIWMASKRIRNFALTQNNIFAHSTTPTLSGLFAGVSSSSFFISVLTSVPWCCRRNFTRHFSNRLVYLFWAQCIWAIVSVIRCLCVCSRWLYTHILLSLPEAFHQIVFRAWCASSINTHTHKHTH